MAPQSLPNPLVVPVWPVYSTLAVPQASYGAILGRAMALTLYVSLHILKRTSWRTIVLFSCDTFLLNFVVSIMNRQLSVPAQLVTDFKLDVGHCQRKCLLTLTYSFSTSCPVASYFPRSFQSTFVRVLISLPPFSRVFVLVFYLFVTHFCLSV